MSDFPLIGGIGIDACQISRMEGQLNKPHFIERIFTPLETAYFEGKNQAAAQSMAAMFAAKEAAMKAFGAGLGQLPLQDIEIRHYESGQPYYEMRGKALEMLQGGVMHLSITHENDMAMAMAVFERKGG